MVDSNLTEDIYNMENSLNELHKKALEFKKRKDKTNTNNRRFDMQLRHLQKTQDICISLMLDELNSLKNDPDRQVISEGENDHLIDISNL